MTGTVALPGSKSITNRAYVLAAQAPSRSTLTNTLRSRDTDLMARALGTLGARVDFLTDTTVAVTGGDLHGGAADSDASQACRKSKETNGSPVEEAQASHASRPMSAIRS